MSHPRTLAPRAPPLVWSAIATRRWNTSFIVKVVVGFGIGFTSRLAASSVRPVAKHIKANRMLYLRNCGQTPTWRWWGDDDAMRRLQAVLPRQPEPYALRTTLLASASTPGEDADGDPCGARGGGDHEGLRRRRV